MPGASTDVKDTSEDPEARPPSRSEAKKLLKGFLLQLGGKVEDAALDGGWAL
jgi:hypothetical protein